MSKNRKKTTTEEMYEDISADYRELSRPDPETGVQKLTDAHIFRILARKYYRSPKTIENILYGRV